MQNQIDSTDNQRVIDALIKSDEITFERVYKYYFATLCNYSSSIVGDSEVAYDIVQNIFIALWEKRKSLDREKSLRNYLLRSTHNNSLRHLQTQKLHKSHHEIIRIEAKEEEQMNVIQHETPSDPKKELYALLDNLPPRSRQVIIMSHIENKRSADIATELSISVRTVETILYQTMKKLRKQKKIIHFNT